MFGLFQPYLYFCFHFWNHFRHNFVFIICFSNHFCLIFLSNFRDVLGGQYFRSLQYISQSLGYMDVQKNVFQFFIQVCYLPSLLVFIACCLTLRPYRTAVFSQFSVLNWARQEGRVVRSSWAVIFIERGGEFMSLSHSAVLRCLSVAQFSLGMIRDLSYKARIMAKFGCLGIHESWIPIKSYSISVVE